MALQFVVLSATSVGSEDCLVQALIEVRESPEQLVASIGINMLRHDHALALRTQEELQSWLADEMGRLLKSET